MIFFFSVCDQIINFHEPFWAEFFTMWGSEYRQKLHMMGFISHNDNLSVVIINIYIYEQNSIPATYVVFCWLRDVGLYLLWKYLLCDISPRRGRVLCRKQWWYKKFKYFHIKYITFMLNFFLLTFTLFN